MKRIKLVDIATAAGTTLITSFILLVIYISLQTYLRPGERFVPNSQDPYWLAMIGLVILGGWGLAWFTNGRYLLVLSLLAALGLVIIPLVLQPEVRTVVLAALWIFLVAGVLGEILLWRLGIQSHLKSGEQPFVWMAVGLFALTILMTILAFARLLYPAVVYAVMLLLSVALVWRVITNRISLLGHISSIAAGLWSGKDHRLAGWIAAILLAAWAGSFIWASAPAIRWDSMSYHLPVPLAYIRNHGMVEMPESAQTYLAHYAEMLYALGLLLKNNSALPGLLHLFSGLLSTGLAYLIGSRLFSKSVGLVTALMFGILPIVTFEAGSAYIDLFLCLYLGVCLLLLLVWLESDSCAALLVSGQLSGFIIGIKISAVVVIVPLWLFVLIRLLLRRRCKVPFWKYALIFFLPAAALAIPWMIRDMLWTGNPVFPSYNHLFQSPKWFTQNLFPMREISTSTTQSLLRLPYDLVIDSSKYYHEAPGGMLGGLPLLFFPWLYGWSPLLSRTQRQTAWILFAATLAALAAGFLMNFGGRYWMPIYLLMALLSGLNLYLVWQAFRKTRLSSLTTVLALLLAGGYVFGSQVAMLTAHWNLPERFPYRYFLGLESGDDFVKRLFPPAEALAFLDQVGGEQLKVLSLGVEQRLFTRAAIYAPMFSKEAYEVFHEPKTAADFAAALDRNGYDYLLVYTPEQDFRPALYKSPALNQSFLNQYTQLEFASMGSLVYRLYFDSDQPLSKTWQNLLRNPGFESLDPSGAPAEWTLYGTPPVVIEDEVYSGRFAVKIEGPYATNLQQILPVTQGELYTLGMQAISYQSNQQLYPIIEWLNVDNRLIRSTGVAQIMQLGWQWYQYSQNAPTGAVTARVIINAVLPGEIIVDNACFVQGSTCP